MRRKRLRQPRTVAVGCDRLREAFHGKGRVDPTSLVLKRGSTSLLRKKPHALRRCAQNVDVESGRDDITRQSTRQRSRAEGRAARFRHSCISRRGSVSTRCGSSHDRTSRISSRHTRAATPTVRASASIAARISSGCAPFSTNRAAPSSSTSAAIVGAEKPENTIT